ncbi:MAG: BREX-6 system BrxE protein [Polyangiaceae bacterium]|nr:BREX-6 system BrxE protein [Polyangiaceae bacterium]
MPTLPDADLDSILAVQIAVAWAGEGRCSPPRLAFWDTDLVSDDGGGDFFARLLPQTHEWAALEAVREAARRVDAKMRGKIADPDRMRTLYFLGFEVDEQLSDRLAALKRSRRKPHEALAFPVPLGAAFSKEALVAALQHPGVSFTTMSGGRQIKGSLPGNPKAMVQSLAAALVPFPDHYPLPFYRLE